MTRKKKERKIKEERRNYDFYMLYCLDCPDKFYIGSSSNLEERMRLHESNCHNPNSYEYHKKAYQSIRENGGWDNWDYIIIHSEKNLTESEAKQHEQGFMDSWGATLNSKSAFSNRKAYLKKYREENRERIKEYYQNNREELLAQRKEKITCECGSIINRGDITKHRKTIKHQTFINNK